MSKFDLKEARNRLVAKDNRMIQRGLFSMNLMENKAINYLVSKIKPDDKPGTTYVFNCQEFQALLNWATAADSYGRVKIMLQNLGDMSWWIDGEINGQKKDILLRWFNIVRADPGTGDIEISFAEDTFPYLCKLQEGRERGNFFTAYKLQNVTLMKHVYSPRIYELLKSYQFNNQKWTFENGTGTEFDIQRRIADTEMDRKNRKSKTEVPKGWANWHIFKRDVLDPAVREINLYTDIKVAYAGKKEDIHRRKTRAIRTIEFYMVGKTEPEQIRTEEYIDAEYREIEEQDRFHQMTLEETFFGAHRKAQEEEKIYKERERADLKEAETEEAIESSDHPALAELLYSKGADFDSDKIDYLFLLATSERAAGRLNTRDARELFACDYVIYYYDQIRATAEETKTTPYRRLIDCIKKDYDNIAEKYIRQYETDPSKAYGFIR